jgi:hypothetical protein
VYLFSVGLTCFFGSYVFLHIRLWRLFDTISDGLTNNGIWAILVGMKKLFESYNELIKSSRLFSLLIVILLIYIVSDIIWKWRDRAKED